MESLPQELIDNPSTTPYIPVYTPIPSSEDAGDDGAKNTFLPPSYSRLNAISFFGARTSHRIQVGCIPSRVRSVQFQRVHTFHTPTCLKGEIVGKATGACI